MIVPEGATHALVYRIKFDDGDPEEGILHVGTLEECERVRDQIPAISYSGDRKALSAETCFVELKVAE